MKIKSIHLYSKDGRRRDVTFEIDGLNVITGRSSTGKSALSEIIEYCMGRSEFNIPEGVIRDKVAWYAVVYQFAGEQVLVAKPTPPGGGESCSIAFLRRGNPVKVPALNDLVANSDDDSVGGPRFCSYGNAQWRGEWHLRLGFIGSGGGRFGRPSLDVGPD